MVGHEWFMSSSATAMRSCPAGGGPPASTRMYSKKSYGTWIVIRLESRKRDAVLRFRDDVVNDGLQVVGLLEHPELPVGAGAAADDLQRVLDVGARAQIIDDVVDELEQLVEQHVEWHFLALSEVDELSACPEAGGARLVLIQQGAAVETPAHVLPVERPQLDGDGLKERGEADGLVDAHGHVADAVLERGKERMRTYVPPDFLRVVDAVGPDEHLHVLVEFAGPADVVGESRAREALEDLGPVALPPGVRSAPERRVDRQPQDR